MKRMLTDQMKDGFNTAYIDKTYSSNLAYKPQFISNNYKEGRKVLSSIEDELLSCKEFFISVAFITMGGVTPLLQTLKELERRHIPGKILTTDYQNFSEPRALRKLAELSNITLKMYRTDEAQEGFHTKGYIFKNEELYRIIVGSSNLTLSALTKNREWNTRVVSTDQGEYVEDLMEEFTDLWDSKYAVAFDDFIDEYSLNYRVIQKQRKIAKQAQIPSLEQYKLQPNSMQLGFIANLDKIQKSGESKALLISATGTGKTYASAFALREEAVKKVLFLVHREQIAKQAIASYKKVFGNTRTFGLLSGNSKDFDADYLFSTMQMMAKPEILSKFQRDEFETIIIDEAHRTGATSYQNIMRYFTPKFWLGMTASPERTDSFDVYEAFDHNIAYEIRLQQALEENLLWQQHIGIVFNVIQLKVVFVIIVSAFVAVQIVLQLGLQPAVGGLGPAQIGILGGIGGRADGPHHAVANRHRRGHTRLHEHQQQKTGKEQQHPHRMPLDKGHGPGRQLFRCDRRFLCGLGRLLCSLPRLLCVLPLDFLLLDIPGHRAALLHFRVGLHRGPVLIIRRSLDVPGLGLLHRFGRVLPDLLFYIPGCGAQGGLTDQLGSVGAFGADILMLYLI